MNEGQTTKECARPRAQQAPKCLARPNLHALVCIFALLRPGTVALRLRFVSCNHDFKKLALDHDIPLQLGTIGLNNGGVVAVTFGWIVMGIRDRDYMKRPSDDDGRGGGSSASDVEEWVGRIFRNKRRLLLYVGIGLGVLIVVAFLAAKLSGTTN